ncbi:TPA: structural protein [Escherichia coli]|nr:structural protein [Escherichia coli]
MTYPFDDKTLPRGIRNNNAGNLRHSGDNWKGKRDIQTDESFVQFVDPVYGLRALMRTLITYQEKHGCRTISSILRRYAPNADKGNNESAYISSVSKKLGIDPDTESSFKTFDSLMQLSIAIIKVENSQMQPYSEEQFRRAFDLL